MTQYDHCRILSLRILTPFFVILAIAAAPRESYAQTSRPSEKTHEELVAEAKKDPIYSAPILNKSGKPLSESEKEQISQTSAKLADAEAARLKGDYETATKLADEALQVRVQILGGKHHLVITANALKTNTNARLSLPKEKRDAVHQADLKLEEAKRLNDEGKYEEARTASTEALRMYETHLKPDDTDIAAALLTLGAACVDLGAFDEADLSLTRSLAIYQTTFGTGHPILGKVEDRLGWMCVLQSGNENLQGEKARKALQHFNTAIRVIAKSAGETQELAESLDNRGTINYFLGNTQEAVRDKVRALVIRETLLGPEARDTGVSYSNLGWLYAQMGKREYVIPFRKKALEIFHKILDQDHPFCLMETSNLARDYSRQGQLDEAIKLYETMRVRDLEKNNPLDLAAADRCVELGTFYIRAGRVDDGVKLYAEAGSRTTKIRESGKKQDALNIMNRVLQACNNARLFEDGLKYYEQVVAWDDADRGTKDKMELIVRAAAMSALQIQNNKADDAIKSLTAILARLKKLVDADSLEMVPPLLNLAWAYTITDQHDKAEKVCEQVLAISEQQSGSQSSGTAYAMMWLGRTNVLQGKYTNAEFNFAEAEKILSQFEQQDPLGMIRLLQEKAVCHSKQGKKDKAVELLRDSLVRCRRWADGNTGPFAKASILEILKSLLENSDAGDAAIKTDRESWVAEANALYDGLEKERALSAKEKDWKKSLK